MNLRLLGLCVLGLSACNGPAASIETSDVEPSVVHTSSGATITLPINVATEHQVDGGRESFRSSDGAVWSVQRLASDTGRPHTLDEVAIALCRRVELGETEGELTHRDCVFAGQQAQCIEGWQTNRAGERVLRRGALIQTRGDVLWISLAIRDGAGPVDVLAEALATETRVGGAT